MRNMTLIFTFLLLASCGHLSHRRPAASEAGSCIEMASHLLPKKRVPFESPEALEIRSALEITRSELDELVGNKFYQKYIFEKEEAEFHERSALILSLIKKGRPDFDEKRVLMRYRRLFKICEG